jgi:hypothetical protein
MPDNEDVSLPKPDPTSDIKDLPNTGKYPAEVEGEADDVKGGRMKADPIDVSST